MEMLGISSLEELQTLSTEVEDDALQPCKICGGEAICKGLGLLKYDVPVEHPNFGKLYRCPNNLVEQDVERQERFRRLSNLGDLVDKSFHNFYIDEKRLKAAEQANLSRVLKDAADFADHPQNWLLLEGGYGCGKTHLAAAIGNYRLQMGDPVLFITVPDLLDHLRGTFSTNSEDTYDDTFDRVRNAPLLILDDLGAENSSAWAREKLFQLFNHRYNKRLPTVVTTNLQLEALDPRIQSRLLDRDLTIHGKIIAPDYRRNLTNQSASFSNLGHYSHMSFENFDTQRKALPDERKFLEKVLKAAREYANSPSRWLVFEGINGSGKTHLAASIAHHLEAQNQDVMFVSVADLLDYLRVTFDPNSHVSFDQLFQIVRNVQFLVLDNFTTEGTTWAREKLFQIVDHRYITGKPTLFTTNTEPDKMEGRIRTRLLDKRGCTIIKFETSSYPSRIARP